MNLDLKQENILLDLQNNIKICNFGVYSFLEQSIQASVTLAGTKSLLNQNCRKMLNLTSQAIFGVVAITFEFCCGKPPFMGSTQKDISLAVLQPHLHERVLPQFLKIVQDMIEKNLAFDLLLHQFFRKLSFFLGFLLHKI
jgi:serine/threonine protein kinase